MAWLFILCCLVFTVSLKLTRHTRMDFLDEVLVGLYVVSIVLILLRISGWIDAPLPLL